MGKQITKKKVKVIGNAEYVNQATGEVEIMSVISVEERDFNFHKLWLKNILDALDLIGNQKVKLAFWIIENLNSENQFIGTYRSIQQKTGMSLGTIKETMDVLLNCNFLRKIQNGVYMVNPDIIFKGGRGGRMNVLIQYNDAKKSSSSVHPSFVVPFKSN